MTKCIGSSNPL